MDGKTGESKTYTYDNAGRRKTEVASGLTTTYNWDFESRITSISRPFMTTNTFAYNGLDTRVSKVDSGGTRAFKRDGAYVTDPVLSDTVGGTSTRYTPGVSERRGTTSRYLHSGIKNADSRTTTGTAVEASRTYDAFGNVTASSGTWQGMFGYAGGFGYQEEPDTGLKLLGHRYYDSTTGRFLSRDRSGSGRNWYSYCANNPLNSADLDGLKRKLLVIRGDTSGRAGLVTAAWYLFYNELLRTYGDEYDVTVIDAPTREEAIDAISDADAVMFYGHGDDGMVVLRGGSKGGKKGTKKGGLGDQIFDRTDVDAVGRKRKAKGKGRLDFVHLAVCDTCADTDLGNQFREAWQAIAWCTVGYTEHTVVEEGWFKKRISKPKVWGPSFRPPRSLPGRGRVAN